MRLLRRIPWWAWLVLPGGLLLALLSKRSGATATLTPLTQAGLDHNVQTSVENQIQAAKTAADTLRNGLGSDALAAKFLGVDLPSLASPAQVAADNTEADGLRAEIAAKTAELAKNISAYRENHNGGQTPQQEASIENSINAAIASLQVKLQALLSKVTGG